MDIVISILAICVAFVALFLSSDAARSVNAAVKHEIAGHLRFVERALQNQTEDIKSLRRRVDSLEASSKEHGQVAKSMASQMAAYDQKIAELHAEIDAVARSERRPRTSPRTEVGGEV